jgi:hypothetical protein
MIWTIYDKFIAPHFLGALFFWIFMLIGIVRILWQVYRILAVSGYYCCKKRGVDTYNKYGNGKTDKDQKSWAIVTGASDGIGLGFCHLLAERGFNIVLLSRT